MILICSNDVDRLQGQFSAIQDSRILAMATSVALCPSDSAEASALGFLALLALGAAPFPPFRLETIETGHSAFSILSPYSSEKRRDGSRFRWSRGTCRI
jgi:hypothetical protein